MGKQWRGFSSFEDFKLFGTPCGAVTPLHAWPFYGGENMADCLKNRQIFAILYIAGIIIVPGLPE